MECKVPQCLASPVCLNTMWVKHSWYTRSVQYLISQQRLHDGTDAQTLYVSHESETHFHGSYRVQRFWLLTSLVFGLFTYALNVLSKINREGRKKTKQNRVRVVSQCPNHGLNASVVYIQGQQELQICAATLVMHPGWPLPPCHTSSENLTWHVYIGFLHLPFKPPMGKLKVRGTKIIIPLRFSEELFFMHTLTDVDIWLGSVHRSRRLSGASRKSVWLKLGVVTFPALLIYPCVSVTWGPPCWVIRLALWSVHDRDVGDWLLPVHSEQAQL